MNQLEAYIMESSENLTLEEVDEAVREIPMIRAELATVELPRQFPHLPVQTELLCRFVEDVYGGQVSREDAGPAFLEAVFAVRYFHKPIDVIPDHLPRIGKLDDALMVQTVIHRHARTFRAFARHCGLPWEDVRVLNEKD